MYSDLFFEEAYGRQMLSFMHAQYTFFQQGYSLLHELDPYMKKLATELDQLVIDSAVEKREMEHKHALIQQRNSSYSNAPARGLNGLSGGQEQRSNLGGATREIGRSTPMSPFCKVRRISGFWTSE
ncbi:UNVERIFIED_CONTAM: hypothetical protein K2H54_009785 [Gekko kuhli]